MNLRWAYFGMFWNYVNCALIAMSLAVVMMGTISGIDTAAIEQKLGQLHTYQDFYTPAATRHMFDVALAGVLFLSWIKVCSN